MTYCAAFRKTKLLAPNSFRLARHSGATLREEPHLFGAKPVRSRNASHHAVRHGSAEQAMRKIACARRETPKVPARFFAMKLLEATLIWHSGRRSSKGYKLKMPVVGLSCAAAGAPNEAGTSHACVTMLTEPKCVSALNARRRQPTRRVRLKSVIALTLHISTTLLLDLVRGRV